MENTICDAAAWKINANGQGRMNFQILIKARGREAVDREMEMDKARKASKGLEWGKASHKTMARAAALSNV